MIDDDPQVACDYLFFPYNHEEEYFVLPYDFRLET